MATKANNVAEEGLQGADPSTEKTGTKSVDEATEKLNKEKAGDAADDKKKFDGNAFNAEDTGASTNDSKDNDPDDTKADGEGNQGEENTENTEEAGSDASFNWDDLDDTDPIYDNAEDVANAMDEASSTEETVIDNDTQTATSPDDAKETAWKQVAKDLKIEAIDYNDFLTKAQQKTQETVYLSDDQNLTKLNNLLAASPEDRMTAVLKESYDYTDEEAIEEITNMKDTKSFLREDKKVQATLKKQKNDYVEFLETKKTEKAKEATDAQKNFTDNLKNQLSKTESILGGSIGDSEKKAILNYITSGKLSEDLLGSPDDLIETAFYRLYRDKIMKIWDAKGVSKGKKSFLDNLSPKRSKTNTGAPVITDGDEGTGEFDPSKFLAE